MSSHLSSRCYTIVLFAFSLFFIDVVSAQGSAYNWENSPSLHQVQSVYANEAAVVIFDKRTHEYKPDDKEGLMVIVTNHRIIKVNNEKGVEQFNKIYLPVSGDGIFLEIKARVITAAGQVIDLPQDKILEVEEEDRSYKKFALEGVEIGSEIEYITIQQKGLYFFGLEVFQYPAPCQMAEFSLSVPEHLVFDVKGYNGFIINSDSVANGTRINKGFCLNISMPENEKYSQPAAFLKTVQYKLSYNTSKEKNVRLFSWNDLAENVFAAYTNTSEKETKAVNTYIKNTKIDMQASEETKIVLLEEYIKNNISINEEGIGEDAEKIEKIITTNVASHFGLNKLFAACLTSLGINYQIVYPSKRNDIPLDSSLENFRLADDLIFYFPSTGLFLEATNITIRYPLVQPYWSATNGLFIEGASTSTGLDVSANFKQIPIQAFDKSKHDIEVDFRLNESNDTVVMHSKQLFTGYGASLYRPAFRFLPKERIQDFTKEVIQSVSKSKEITNIQVHNTDMTDGNANKPLIFEGDIRSVDLIEKAGKKLLVKIGDVIGPQEQLYQEKTRQLPISMDYPHTLDRLIRFEIPPGYFVKNPDDLSMNVMEENNDNASMGFVSKYSITDNKLVVSIHEYYKYAEYPIQKFTIFQKVINAAADFNKIVLVLEKK